MWHEYNITYKTCIDRNINVFKLFQLSFITQFWRTGIITRFFFFFLHYEIVSPRSILTKAYPISFFSFSYEKCLLVGRQCHHPFASSAFPKSRIIVARSTGVTATGKRWGKAHLPCASRLCESARFQNTVRWLHSSRWSLRCSSESSRVSRLC